MRSRLPILLALLTAALFHTPAEAMKRVDIDEELRLIERGERPRLEIPDARYRVAVFTYEDPDSTGLGNALAALLGQEILLKSGVRSIGVLRYESGLSPTAAEALSYFDKVEKITEAQAVTLAAWGMVRRLGDRIQIDTYLQLPPPILQETFAWRLRLPARMGGGELWAHLRPDRFLLQRHEVSAYAVAALGAAALRLDELRAEPRDSAPPAGSLPVGSVYWFGERSGDWIEVHAPERASGWVRFLGHCTGECAPLLDAGAFAAGLLRFMDSRRLPGATETLTLEARAVLDQIAALEELGEGTAEELDQLSRRLASRWLGRADAGSGPVPPGGAAFANLRSLARIAAELKLAARQRRQQGPDLPPRELYDALLLEPAQVAAVAYELAERSQVDPRNADVLHNLGVLFEIAGDSGRARLARDLEKDAAPRTPDPTLP